MGEWHLRLNLLALGEKGLQLLDHEPVILDLR